MAGLLLTELQQTKPFRSPVDEAYLNLQRTADLLRRAVVELLKPHDLSPAQYNVLRILRGSQGKALACCEVGSRLVTFEPDVTRLVDRLVGSGLVSRSADASDRRVVRLHITAQGLALLKQLDAPIAKVHAQNLGRLDDEKLQQLISLLEEIRTPA